MPDTTTYHPPNLSNRLEYKRLIHFQHAILKTLCFMLLLIPRTQTSMILIPLPGCGDTGHTNDMNILEGLWTDLEALASTLDGSIARS
jgi:hypothetical protein